MSTLPAIPLPLTSFSEVRIASVAVNSKPLTHGQHTPFSLLVPIRAKGVPAAHCPRCRGYTAAHWARIWGVSPPCGILPHPQTQRAPKSVCRQCRMSTLSRTVGPKLDRRCRLKIRELLCGDRFSCRSLRISTERVPWDIRTGRGRAVWLSRVWTGARPKAGEP